METIRVLHMDDEPGFTRLIKMSLERTGRFNVTSANDPEQALRVLDHYSFDVMISDVVTPGIGGIELHKIVAEKFPKLPVGFLTAIISPRVKQITIDGLPCIAKPVTLEALQEFIDQLLKPTPPQPAKPA